MALGRGYGLKPLGLSLPAPDRKMRVFCAVVLTASCVLSVLNLELFKHRAVGPKLVCNNALRLHVVITQEFSEQSEGRLCVASGLNNDVQDRAFIINSPPEVNHLAIYLGVNFVQVPSR